MRIKNENVRCSRELTLKIKETKKKFSIHDFSYGGISFLVPPDETDFVFFKEFKEESVVNFEMVLMDHQIRGKGNLSFRKVDGKILGIIKFTEVGTLDRIFYSFFLKFLLLQKIVKNSQRKQGEIDEISLLRAQEVIHNLNNRIQITKMSIAMLEMYLLKIEEMKEEEKDPEQIEKLSIFRGKIKSIIKTLEAFLEEIELLVKQSLVYHNFVTVEKEFERKIREDNKHHLHSGSGTNLIEIIKTFSLTNPIKLSAPKDSIYVPLERIIVKTVFENLIKNSLEANAKNIYIDIKKENRRIVVVVKDDGDGIPISFLPYLFAPRYSTKAKERGGERGLGLWSTMETMKRIGGDIEFIAQMEKAKGDKIPAIFKLTFPER